MIYERQIGRFKQRKIPWYLRAGWNFRKAFFTNKTRTVRIFDGVSQTTTLAYTAGDVITLDVFPYVSNAGLPTGCPTLTANKLERVSFMATDSGVIGNNGTTYFYGALFRVQINNDVYPMTSAKGYELAEGASLGAELNDGLYSKAGNVTLDGSTITATSTGWGYIYKEASLPVGSKLFVSIEATASNQDGWNTKAWDSPALNTIYSKSNITDTFASTEFVLTTVTPTTRFAAEFRQHNIDSTLTINNLSIKQLPTKHFQYVNSPAAITLTQDGVTGEWLGGELIVNGGFDSSSNWSLGSGWSITGGEAVYTIPAPANTPMSNVLTAILNLSYRVSYDVSVMSGSFVVYLGTGASGVVRYSSGSYLETILAGSGGTIYAFARTGFSGELDNISVKQLFQLSTFMQAKYREEQLMAKWEAEKHQPRYFFEGDGATRYIPLPSAITLTGDFVFKFKLATTDTATYTAIASAIDFATNGYIRLLVNGGGFQSFIRGKYLTYTGAPLNAGKNISYVLRGKGNTLSLSINGNVLSSISGVTDTSDVVIDLLGRLGNSSALVSGTLSDVMAWSNGDEKTGTLVYASRLNRNDGLAINEIGLGDEIFDYSKIGVGHWTIEGTNMVRSTTGWGRVATDASNRYKMSVGKRYVVEVSVTKTSGTDELKLYKKSTDNASNVVIASVFSGIKSTNVVELVSSVDDDYIWLDSNDWTGIVHKFSIKEAPLSAAIVNPEVSPQLYNHISGTYNGWAGKELITNGDFSGGLTGWTAQSEWSYYNGMAKSYGIGASQARDIYQLSKLTIGNTYLASVDVKDYIKGELALWTGYEAVSVSTASGRYTNKYSAGSTRFTLYNFTNIPCDYSIDNVSVKRFIEEV